jgi:hypothetical protein
MFFWDRPRSQDLPAGGFARLEDTGGEPGLVQRIRGGSDLGTRRHGRATAIKLFFLGCVVVAGVFGAVTVACASCG